MTKTKRAVISGANGFIGKHLWDLLIERDIEPIALDRHDLYIDVPSLTETIFSYKPNYIIHLAAYGNHRNQMDDTQTIMANYFGTYNLLKATDFLEYEAFINIGSSSMYGIQATAMNEEESVLFPDTFYAATKAGGHFLARAFAKQYNKPITTVVPFSVYGEGESSNRFIPRIVNHLLTGEEMKVTLLPTHDWVHVDDFTQGILKVINNIQSVKGELVNIGTGKATHNADIIEMLEDISGKQLTKFIIDNPNTYDSPLWYADNRKLLNMGWRPQISLKEGLKKCWNFYNDLAYDKN